MDYKPLLKHFAELLAESVINKLPESQAKQPEEKLLSRDETCEFLNIKPTTLWEWTNKGKIKAYGISGKRYYKQSELLDSLIELKK